MDIVHKDIKEKWTKYIYMAMLVFLFLFKPSFKSSIDTASLIVYILIFLFSTIIHFLSQKNKNWFRLDISFFIGLWNCSFSMG